jgi:hypothetical protein
MLRPTAPQHAASAEQASIKGKRAGTRPGAATARALVCCSMTWGLSLIPILEVPGI